MPRTEITVQTIGRAGSDGNNDIEPTYAAVDNANGNYFTNVTGKVYLEVINGSGGSLTVTIVVVGTTEGENNPDKTYTVPDGERRKIGPFNSFFENADKQVFVDWSTGTSVTTGAFYLPAG